MNFALLFCFAYFLICQCHLLHEMCLSINYSHLELSAVAHLSGQESILVFVTKGKYLGLFQHGINLI